MRIISLRRLGAWLESVFGPPVPHPQSIHPYDIATGLDTSGLLYADKLATGHAHDRHSEGYYATAPSLFHGAVARWRITLAGHALEDYAFVDLGCGKGRVLLLAAAYPFRSITGVELHAGLARTARRNVGEWLRTPRACGNITVLAGDVLSAPIPEGPVVLFLFNAFTSEIVSALLARLSAAAPARTAPIDLIYIHPDHDALVRRTPGIELLADTDVHFTAEDAAADVFGVKQDHCTIYRLHPRRAV